MFSRRRRSENRELTNASYVLTSERGYRRYTRFTLLVLLLGAALGFGYRYFEDQLVPPSRVAALEKENRELHDAASKARFDLEVELATRNELERQLASLNEQLKQAREELAFVKAASAPRSGG